LTQSQLTELLETESARSLIEAGEERGWVAARLEGAESLLNREQHCSVFVIVHKDGLAQQEGLQFGGAPGRLGPQVGAAQVNGKRYGANLVKSKGINRAGLDPPLVEAAGREAQAELKRDGKKKNTVQGFYHDISEVEHALQQKAVGLHSKIKFRWAGVDENGGPALKWYETTPGRVMLGQVLPRNVKTPFDVVNKLMTKREISGMIDQVYRHCGQKETVIFCDRIMALGFHNAFKAGISFGKDDMVVPSTKWKIIEQTRTLAKEFEQQYNDGLITHGEKYNKVVDAWSKTTDQIADEMMRQISSVEKGEGRAAQQVNSIYMMAQSGARGSPAQMRQLAGMRGLMAKPSGEIIETPIISNFKEGLSVLEYFNSTHGARKGLADTALKTANSGYLTRRS